MHAISISCPSLFIFVNIKAEELSLVFWFSYCLFQAQGFLQRTNCSKWILSTVPVKRLEWPQTRICSPPVSALTFCLCTKDLAEKVLGLSMSKVQFIFTDLGPAGLLRIAGTRQLCLAFSVTVTSRKPIITGKPSENMSAHGLQKEKTVRLK